MRRRALISTLVALSTLACTSIRTVDSAPFDGEGGALQVRVFADDDAREAGSVLPASLVGELERRAGRGDWVPVFRSLEPSWTVAGLQPGRYRVIFSERLDESGEVEGLARPVSKEVEVVEGEVARVEVVLDHVSPAMITAGAVGIVVAAVLLHELLDDLDLPTPPAPPAWAVETAFWVTLDLAAAPDPWVERTRGPQVTSTFPEPGDLVAAARPRLVFSLSEPLDPSTVGADAVRVRTAEGEPLAGRVEYDAKRWWLLWEPVEDLPRGARIEATLAAGLAGRHGEPLALPAALQFDTAR